MPRKKYGIKKDLKRLAIANSAGLKFKFTLIDLFSEHKLYLNDMLNRIGL